ncbi:MAG TPA: hypothetical protein VGD79_09805 [Thermoanaerobaculia bacterium]|jgi:hypothetical protein
MMNEHHFDAEIMLSGRGEAGVWSSAASVLRERVYGNVRVRAQWSVPGGTPVLRVPLQVIDERERGDARDLPAYVELYFHDAFLLFNLAAPGSFGGVVSVTGGPYRVNEIELDPRTFAYVSASLQTLSLRDVAAWYDSLQIGTRQIATAGPAVALFQLLHLARGPEDDDVTVLRLARAADALSIPVDTLVPLREAILRGAVPVLHPMADDVLDPAVDDAALDRTAAIDDAAGRVIAALQSLVI